MPRHSEDGICFKDRQSRYRARQVFMHFRLAVSAAAKVREAKSASRALSVPVLNDRSTAKSTETTVNAKAKAFDSCMVTSRCETCSEMVPALIVRFVQGMHLKNLRGQSNVRFGPLCGLKSDISRGPRSAINRLMHCKKNDYSSSSARRWSDGSF